MKLFKEHPDVFHTLTKLFRSSDRKTQFGELVVLLETFLLWNESVMFSLRFVEINPSTVRDKTLEPILVSFPERNSEPMLSYLTAVNATPSPLISPKASLGNVKWVVSC